MNETPGLIGSPMPAPESTPPPVAEASSAAVVATKGTEGEQPHARIKRLRDELTRADKFYKAWSDEFKTDRLEDFVVKSKQRRSTATDTASFEQDSYIVNELSPSLNARLPALMFDTPRAIVTPRDPLTDDPKVAPVDPAAEAMAALTGQPMVPPPVAQAITAEHKAKLREDVLNTILQDESSGFVEETNLSMREAFFRFGVVEAFYTADFRQIDESFTVDIAEGQSVEAGKIAPRIPTAERIRFRRIRAEDFRVSANSKNKLERSDWCGYYEWVFVDDLRKNPNYTNVENIPESKISSSGAIMGVPTAGEQGASEGRSAAPADGMVRIFKMWHMRERKRYVWIDQDDQFLCDGKPYKTMPISALTFDPILDQFYPVPPCFNWTGVQIEYNETRDMQRTHRRRALRKFIYQEGAFTDAEIGKLSSNEDMAFAQVSQQIPLSGACRPLEMAPMDPISGESYMITKAEMQEVTKVGGEQKGFAESKTASQANIIAVNKQVQDSTDRNRVAKWLSKLSFIALKLAEEYFTLPAIIKTSVDMTGPQPGLEQQKVKERWLAIKMDDLGELEYEVSIDVESMSPPNSTLQAQQWNQLLALLSQPSVLALMAASETLARKTLSIYGIRDEEQVQEIIKVARLLTGAGAAPGAPVPGAAPPSGGDPAGQQAMLQQAPGAASVKPRNDDDWPEINSGVTPPASLSVDERERKPLLYLPSGVGLYTRIGFRTGVDAKRAKVTR